MKTIVLINKHINHQIRCFLFHDDCTYVAGDYYEDKNFEDQVDQILDHQRFNFVELVNIPMEAFKFARCELYRERRKKCRV